MKKHEFTTIKHFIEVFEKYLGTLHYLSDNSLKTQQGLLALLKKFQYDSVFDLIGFVEYMSQRMGNNSYNLRLLSLKQFYRWAVEAEYIEHYPKFLNKMNKKKLPPDFVVITDDERALLSSYDGKWDDAAHVFYLMLYTGLHYQDFYNLRDINFQNQYIVSYRQKTGTQFKIPIHRSIKDKILYRPWIGKAVFNRQLKKIFGELGVAQDVTLCNSSGEYVSRPKNELVMVSTARHSFATSCLQKLVPHNVIMQWCGWTHPQMIFYYADRMGIETESYMDKF